MCLARPIDRVPLLLVPAMSREIWAHPARFMPKMMGTMSRAEIAERIKAIAAAKIAEGLTPEAAIEAASAEFRVMRQAQAEREMAVVRRFLGQSD